MIPTHTRDKIIWLESVDSTNDELRRRIHDLDNLSVVAARRQSAGRGQGDHKWHSRGGENLTFSILLRFTALDTAHLQTINDFVTGVLLEFLASEGVQAWVKLPNDIWVGDRKIAGILIENILEGKRVAETVVGIGLNLNQTQWPSDLPNPVSLKELSGKEYPPERTLERISDLCKKNWNMFNPA